MTPALRKIWCDEDEHFADFNAWLDGEDGQAAQIDYGVDALPQPSKALFAGDRNGYEEAFQAFRKACRHEALGESWFQEQLGDDHWFLRNVDHFIQLVDLMAAGAVVPVDNPPIKLEMDLSHFLGDFIDLMPLLHWLHRAVPQSATGQYLSAMQRVFHGYSFATQQTDENLRMALDNLLRALSSSGAIFANGEIVAARLAFRVDETVLPRRYSRRYRSAAHRLLHREPRSPERSSESLDRAI